MKFIMLTQGKVAIVDDSDYDWLNQWKWTLRGDSNYAVRSQHLGMINGKQKQQRIIMHRVIMAAPEGMSVDHINGNGLDNRKSNLRVCTHRQNMQNTKLRVGTSSKYKGVVLIKNKISISWLARIVVDGKRKCLGYYPTEEEAAIAYNEAATKYFGEFKRLNLVVANG